MENRLRLLFSLQRIDSEHDDIRDLKGDLPQLVANLEQQLSEKEASLRSLQEQLTKSIVQRDEHDLEIASLREKIEKYKGQQFEVKTNKQYDALTREIEFSQEKINTLDREIEVLEGRAKLAKDDQETIKPLIESLRADLGERKEELEVVNKEHEEEELKLQHERDKVLVQIAKPDIRFYERIRQAKDGIAVVAVRRNACGGCFKRVPPQILQELRKNAQLMTCEHCGRILVSDDIVEAAAAQK